MFALVSVVLLASCAILTVANPVEYAPWWTLCANYWSTTWVIERCRGHTLDIHILIHANQETITANMLRTAVAHTCRSDALGPYVACARNRTAGCTPKDRAAVMAEVQTFYSMCQGQSTVADWINDYALNGFAYIEIACLQYNNYESMWLDVDGDLRLPNQTTPITEALAMTKYNSAVLLLCTINHVRNVVPTIPGCSATWQDVFFALLLQMTDNSRLGIRVYPEMIPMLQDIRSTTSN